MQAADLVPLTWRKRKRKPCTGVMLQQDGSREMRLKGQPALDVPLTMIDADSEIYSAYLIDKRGTTWTFEGLTLTWLAGGKPSSLQTGWGSHSFRSPVVGSKDDRDPTTLGAGLPGAWARLNRSRCSVVRRVFFRVT